MSNPFAVGTLGVCTYASPLPSRFFIEDDAGIVVDATLAGCGAFRAEDPAFLECAGPRRRLYFDPARVTAGIVTCGGLCPGLNDVIRALTMVLWHRYGVRRILGYRYGYEGLVPTHRAAGTHEPLVLTPDLVEDIHNDGGTILGSSRGPQDTARIVDCLVADDVQILFTIGGDGTQRGARDITHEISRRGAAIAVVGLPKTIDNDVNYTERTFGFETAVAMSRGPIHGAHREARAVRNGIGLVKLMGRESGFVAACATLASSDVNLVLVPEVPFTLAGLYRFLEERLARKSHAVIVTAEGAGQDLVPVDGTDASGNRRLGDIGTFLKARIPRHFQSIGRTVSMKYIDPSYTIRSAPATADDSVFCFQLAGNAVHAAMTGRTGMVVCLWNGHFVHIPVEKAVEQRKTIDPDGFLWQTVLDNTGQPDTLR